MVVASRNSRSVSWTWSNEHFSRQTREVKQVENPNGSQLYKRARYYDPSTGEFVSQDPLEYVDGMSLYRGYFLPDSVDPMGLDKPDHIRDFQLGIGPEHQNSGNVDPNGVGSGGPEAELFRTIVNGCCVTVIAALTPIPGDEGAAATNVAETIRKACCFRKKTKQIQFLKKIKELRERMRKARQEIDRLQRRLRKLENQYDNPSFGSDAVQQMLFEEIKGVRNSIRTQYALIRSLKKKILELIAACK